MYNFHYFEELKSTNTYLKEKYQEYQDKSIVIAKIQTAGRGRNLRKWISDDDLTFSILFKKQHNNCIIAPLALVLALQNMKISASIKWPNDVYVNGKKLAGILVEDIYSSSLEASIVGIGINYTRKEEFNSIGIAEFINIGKTELLNLVLDYYEKLINAPNDLVMKMYKANSFIIHRKIIYKDEEYFVCDILENGSLLIGNEKLFKEIKCDEIDILSSIIA